MDCLSLKPALILAVGLNHLVILHSSLVKKWNTWVTCKGSWKFQFHIPNLGFGGKIRALNINWGI